MKNLKMIKQLSNPKLKKPIFIAAWPGMGEVAYRSALFLKEAMNFKMFAKLRAEFFFKPAAVSVKAGIANIPKPPAGLFYYYKGKEGPDIILFLGQAQPPLEHAEELSKIIIKFIKRYSPKLTITFAAKPESIDHKHDLSLWLAATHPSVIKQFEKAKTKVLKKGQISGLNGILLGVAKDEGLKGACVLAEIPFYTAQIENPRATAIILDLLVNFLRIKLDISSVWKRAKFIEKEIDKLISYLKGEAKQEGPSPLSEEDVKSIKKDLAAYTKVPQSARGKIEELFKKAKKDITAASELKKELDDWNAYKEYEDRFLDLFRDKGKGKGTH
ncbi:MAG: PAC2 family protein [Candidatus Omnitrophica bacterium]|nr:PAC2 family protein [Candidatus Omnitrophota bacterium]MCF7893668.1 PAC2 family protein [Candidatus Omnitrophota bacterium]